MFTHMSPGLVAAGSGPLAGGPV